jgi:lipid II:glycine glycyltransferase (peptidoglycan interpeptide bridge formation enzyme)
MEIKEISDKEAWERFFEQCREKTFLQSWNWGEFQMLQGNKIWRFGVYNGDDLLGAALVVRITAKRGTFLFVPHGPAVKDKTEISKYQILNSLLEELKKLAVVEAASFVRVSPIWQRNEINKKTFQGLGFRQAPIHMHAEETWELDIRSPEEELLSGMRKTTRYLIRQAQKNKDIHIVKSHKTEDLEKFNEVYLETAKRHSFVVFPTRYLKDEFSAFSNDNQIMIFFGKYKGEIVSAAIFVFWQDMAFYHHSGSLSKYSKFPVSYLLQWEAIKEAKKRGCAFYNFWGVAPNINPTPNTKHPTPRQHPWAGLTLFKMGFGGYLREFIKTQDFIISSKYWVNYLIEKLRKLKRGL